MRFDVRRHRLDDCLDALIDYRGKTPKKTESGIPLVTAKVIKDGRIDVPTEFIAHADFDAWMTRGLPQVGDVVMTTEAPLGEVGQVRKLPVALAQRIVTLRGKRGLLHNDYLLYAMQSEPVQAQLRGRASGTTVVGIKQSELRKITLDLPSFDEQVEVAAVLRSLDDRIDLLRQTNATLESIAQALFKSWFIDFDPVRAKAEGREPEGMDAKTAALFPSEFEESALGLIPKGWRIRAFGELSESIFSGGTPDTRRPEYWSGTLPWFSSGETRETVVIETEKCITQAAIENSTTRLAMRGDVLVASAGQGLTRGQTSYCALDTYINQSVVCVRANLKLTTPAWIFYNLARRYEELRGISDSHSIRGSLTTKLLASLRVLSPPPPLSQRFGETADLLLVAQADHRRRARTLARVRDTLLPRLISGKLRAHEAREHFADIVS